MNLKSISRMLRAVFDLSHTALLHYKHIGIHIGIHKVRGQATLEAAFLIPIVFIGLLLLMQPGIILYDRMIMNATASEACRLLATKTDAAGSMDESCRAFVCHRLNAIPDISVFHVRDIPNEWDIVLQGDENSERVRVEIAHEVRPLPFLDISAKLLGLVNDRGNLRIHVACSQKTQPDWLSNAEGEPSEWIGAWVS